MDKSLYLGMVSAKETEYRKAVNTNNIVNSTTDGFRRQMVSSKALHSQGPGLQSRVYNLTYSTGVDSRDGALEMTGNPRDLTVTGREWFVVKNSGGEYLTKNISLEVNSFGELVDQNGASVETRQGVILVPENAEISVADNGNVYFRLPEQPQLVLAGDLRVVDVPPESVRLDSTGRVVSDQMVDVVVPSVLTGARQGSNVNPMQETVEGISLSKQFEMDMKIMDSARKMSEAANRILGN